MIDIGATYNFINAVVDKNSFVSDKGYYLPKEETGSDKNNVVLYHGSHRGVSDKIVPNSRNSTDFGSGFYAGNNIDQVKMLISKDENGVFYTLSVDMSGLNVYSFDDDIVWALYVGVHRGYIEKGKYKKLERMCDMIDSYDIIIGKIADDRIYYIFMDFVKRNVCDKVLKDSLALVRLGNQYVFKTKRACDRIKIESAGFLSENEKRRYSAYDKNIKGTITGGVEAIKARYRRANDVFFIDEILERYR